MIPETEIVLQAFLIRKAEEWQRYCKEYSELALASYHITPDGAWIAREHEKLQPVSDSVVDVVVRSSPACTTIITKI